MTPGSGCLTNLLSGQLNAEVRAETVPLDVWVDEALASGLEGYQLDALTMMFEYYDRYGLIGNPRVLESLLGRRATRFESFVARALKV